VKWKVMWGVRPRSVRFPGLCFSFDLKHSHFCVALHPPKSGHEPSKKGANKASSLQLTT
jgi:hypothetical protein